MGRAMGRDVGKLATRPRSHWLRIEGEREGGRRGVREGVGEGGRFLGRCVRPHALVCVEGGDEIGIGGGAKGGGEVVAERGSSAAAVQAGYQVFALGVEEFENLGKVGERDVILRDGDALGEIEREVPPSGRDEQNVSGFAHRLEPRTDIFVFVKVHEPLDERYGLRNVRAVRRWMYTGWCDVRRE